MTQTTSNFKQAYGLIIDDDPRVNEILANGLPHFSFDFSNSINSAREKLHDSATFDFILLDYKIGASNGLSLIPMIHEKLPMASVLLISAYGTKELLQTAILSRIDAYLDKPIDLKVYENQLKTILEKKGLLCSQSYEDSVRSLSQLVSDKEDVSKTLKDYAKKHNKNYQYLSQMFKKYNQGKTFQSQKSKERYMKVKQLLLHTQLTITAISKQSGFSHPSALMKGFKDRFGMTMSEFRRTHK